MLIPVSRKVLLLLCVSVCFAVLVWVCIPTQYVTPNIFPAKWDSNEEVIKSDRIVFDAVDQKQQPIYSTQQDEPAPPRAQHAVLIKKEARSGSSFVGDVLNHHKDVMYYNEPLLSKVGRQKIAYSPEASVAYFDYLFKCMADDRSGINRKVFETYLPRARQWSKKLFLSQKRRQFDATLFNRYCKRMFSHNIIKGLMVTSMEGLINGTSMPVTVVHLIRDPRARAVSCIDSGQAGPVTISNYKEYFTRTCNNIMKDHRYGVKHLAKKGQYKVFRYEDTCSNLTKQMQSMLEFVGLPVYKEFLDYLDDINSVKEVSAKELRNHYHSVKRVISDQLVTWRSKLKLEYLEVIETACKDLMDTFGYKPVNGDMNMLRNISIPLHLARDEKGLNVEYVDPIY